MNNSSQIVGENILCNTNSSKPSSVRIGGLQIGAGQPMAFIAGPCVIETEEATLELAFALKNIARENDIPLIFKASFDKANRSSIGSFRGPGLKKGLGILKRVKEATKLPIVTDIHLPEQAASAADVVDLIQIPAFLSRQTDLLVAAAKTEKPVNVKKGQFLSPIEMKNIVSKLRHSGCDKILLTERGASFGYRNLVVDFRSLYTMRSFGCPVIFDGTHSVQLPGGEGTRSGGEREFVFPLVRAAKAVGVDAVFLEVHKNPSEALCDGANSIDLEQFQELINQLKTIPKF